MTHTRPICFRHAIAAWALLAALLPAWAPPAEAKLGPAPFEATSKLIANGWWFEFEWSPRADLFAVNSGQVIRLFDGISLKQTTLYRTPKNRFLQSLAWSPDGTRLAATEGPNIGGRQFVTDKIIILNAKAGGKAVKWASGRVGAGKLAWTRDGKRILYGAGTVLRAVNPATGKQENFCKAHVGLIDGAAQGAGQILYLVNSQSTSTGLWVVDVKARTARPAWLTGTHGPAVLNPPFSNIQTLAVRPHAPAVAFGGTLSTGDTAINLWETDTNRMRTVAQSAANPAWSPDGQWLFFAVTPGDGVAVYSMADGQTYAVAPTGNGRVKISADGTRILHTGGDERDDQGVFLTVIRPEAKP